MILLTAFGCIPDAVTAMRNGACDYIRKPFTPEQVKEHVLPLLGAKKIRHLLTGKSPTLTWKNKSRGPPRLETICRVCCPNGQDIPLLQQTSRPIAHSSLQRTCVCIS